MPPNAIAAEQLRRDIAKMRARVEAMKKRRESRGDPAEPGSLILSHPIDVSPARDPNRYITGTDALNLMDETVGIVAGWHEYHCFWSTKAHEPIETAGAGWTVPKRTLGGEGVRDARASLRRLGHPGGDLQYPIWAALHARAIVDLAFHRCKTRRTVPTRRWWPIEPWTVADWVWTAEQMERVKELAAKALDEVPEQHRAGWERWMKELEPFKTHTDFELAGPAVSD